MEKILVSACLMGEKVRYDGKSQQLLNESLLLWQQQQRIVSLCPEVAGGLSIPRYPAEIQLIDGRVINCKDEDVSQQFIKGAEHALHVCQKLNIRFALMKESSPSCGSNMIYDGSFSNKKIIGEGVTVGLLRENGVKVFSEKNIMELVKAINNLS
ncbi:MAG: DUF523 domain-containing protein [Colwelliaceae bacterium]|jgi:uncharacterized protein YbbK (DUF523 family)|nr:DUF523 domain-containing protein [Colwelliaceae bacterium]